MVEALNQHNMLSYWMERYLPVVRSITNMSHNFSKHRKRIIANSPVINCYYCNIELTADRNGKKRPPENFFTMDHLHPKSKGGSNNITNLKVCCLRCNVKRGKIMNKRGKKKIEILESYLRINPNLHPDFFKYLFNSK